MLVPSEVRAKSAERTTATLLSRRTGQEVRCLELGACLRCVDVTWPRYTMHRYGFYRSRDTSQ